MTFISFLSVITTLVHVSSSVDICTSEFIGTSGEECWEYGFCSSCVSNGCSWCEPTSRCVKHNNDCAQHAAFGLTSLAQCTEEYSNDYRERPDASTTDYSPHLSEIMAMYAKFAKVPVLQDDGTYNLTKVGVVCEKFDTCTLEQSTIRVFHAEVTDMSGDRGECEYEQITSGANQMGLIIDSALWLTPYTAILAPLAPFKAADAFFDGFMDLVLNSVGYTPDLTDRFSFILDGGVIDEYGLNLINAGFAIKDILATLNVDTSFLDKFLTDNIGEHQVIVAVDDVNEAIVVAFRATSTPSTWTGYIRCCLLPWDQSSLSQLKQDLGISLDVEVMEIVNNAYVLLKELFYPYVKQLISEYPDYDLFLAGHSLGGALTGIFVLDIYADYYNSGQPLDASKINVYTFGQPRVGNEGYASLVNAILDYKYYRVVTGKDFVTQMPPWLFGYRHTGIEIHYGRGDYINDVMCQYRECTVLDPYEDMACRNRYKFNDIDWSRPVSMIEDIMATLVQLLSNIVDDTMPEWWEEGYLKESFDDHHPYAKLGRKGHCNTYTTSVENPIKCDDRTAALDIDTDDYRCVDLSLVKGLGNVISQVFDGGGALDNLNGCGNAGNDMHCCLGTLRSERVCVESGGALDLTCPTTNIGEYCLDDDDCQNGFLNEVVCRDGICKDPGVGIGQKCFLNGDCMGYNLLGAGTACCRGRCEMKQLDYAGMWWCPHLCRKKWYSWFNTCHEKSNGQCDEFRDSQNPCPEIKEGWNLAIRIGDSQYAGTDARIMFSYCINRACSDWYRLGHQNWNDYYGWCMSEFYIVPGMSEAIESALETYGTDVALDFEFATCGSKSGDGLQIDQIGIGHEAALVDIDLFVHANDDEFCRFKATDEESFTVDSDACDKVSVSWTGETSSVIYKGLISERCLDDICSTVPNQASSSTGCQVQGLLDAESPIVDYPVNRVVHVFEISDGAMWILIAFSMVLASVTVWNVAYCWRHTGRPKYQRVRFESSADEC